MDETAGTRVVARFRVTEKQDGLRLDRFLKERIPKLSRVRIQEAIRCRVELPGGGRPKPSRTVRPGDLVVLHDEVVVEPELDPALAPSVLHEDDALVAAMKPAGLPVHSTRRVVRNQLVRLLRERYGPSLALAHRIDRETSGIVLLTRSAEAARRVGSDFARGRVHKEYLAVVRGVPPASWQVDLPVGRDLGSTVYIKQAAGTGAPSRTRFVRERVGGSGLVSLVRALPVTGRRHQIRVHLQASGHPVVGDKLYAAGERHFLNFAARGLTPAMRAELGAARQLLHAAVLELAHPVTGAPLRIECAPPGDFAEALDGPPWEPDQARDRAGPPAEA